MSGPQSGNSLLNKEDIEQLLKGRFGKTIHLLSLDCTPATKAGDNYGSTLLSLVVSIQGNQGAQGETLNIIAKMAPPTAFLCELFDFPITFCKEIYVYKLVAPALFELQQECGISKDNVLDIIPFFYGGRTSLKGDADTRADTSAVLLLRNLRPDGYRVADRLSGLNLSHSELVMNSLSAFHATIIALKQKNLAVFKETVLKCTSEPFHIGPKNVDIEEEAEKFLGQMVVNAPECQPYMEKVRKCTSANRNFQFKSVSREPFATLVHNDFWTNNMLFKYKNVNGSEIPYTLKIIDFQMTSYCSPVKDLLFFLYSSVEIAVLDSYFEHLVDLYYKGFIRQLEELQCDTSTFSKALLLKEIGEFAGTQLEHIIFMLGIIYAEKEETMELSTIKSVDQTFEAGANAICRKRIMYVLKDYDRKGWMESKISKS